jgi:hypothetical protein
MIMRRVWLVPLRHTSTLSAGATFLNSRDSRRINGVNSSNLSSKDYELSVRVQLIDTCTTSMGLRFCSVWYRMLDA